tara:strand:+ start:334 stop:1422 length:1089 start_codon:yes stop_codon:yes gene_type:complete
MKRKFITFLKSNKKKKFFIISGKNSYFKSNFDKFFKKHLKKIDKSIYFKKKYFPEIDELKNIIKKVKKFNPDILLAIGGGCALDYAKIASVSSKTTKFSIKNFNKVKINKKIFLVTVPTTAGSGSEVTEGAVIYKDKIKHSLEHKFIIPDRYFLIPELVLENSKKIKSNSGFDALSQSIESILSNKSNRQSIGYAERAIKILNQFFIKYYLKPTKFNAYKMQLAANLAGKAICISKTTAPHAVSYPFSIYFKLSHGHAVSLTFNEFIKFNFQNMHKAYNKNLLKKKFHKIFKSTNTNNIYEFISFIHKLKKQIKFETKLEQLSINLDKNLSKILKGVNIKRLKNNPVRLTKKDITNILYQIK